MTQATSTINIDGMVFKVRPNTSDEKAIREVVERRGYGRYNFVPMEGEHWIDLGANIGAFSVWAARQHPSITVQAYEADPEMCDLVELNARLNGVHDQVQVYHSAVVADSRRRVTLHCNTARGNVWRNSIEREWRGGEDITVPAFHIKKVLKATPDGSYLKMDIEGTEMPILEWMFGIEQAWGTVKKLQGMVFEWSFDVDRSIDRFRQVVKCLEGNYDTVKNAGLPADAPDEWPPSWNPPCRLVWAWNE